MVENSVKYYFYAVIVKLFADSSERIVIAEPSVYFFIIYGVVAVFRRFKDGTEINCVNVHFFEMRNPVKQLVKPVYDRTSFIDFRRSAEAERVYVIYYRVVIPVIAHIYFHLSFYLASR